MTVTAPTVTIPRRFNGPPTSGHGGYSCGAVAELVDGVAEVTLRMPPPLDVAMSVERNGEHVRVVHAGAIVAEARPTHVDAADVPPPVALDAAERASRGYPGFEGHAFPTCFACGPDRVPGDGLRIFPGPVEGTDIVAASWTPSGDLGDPVEDVFLWAALDCPSGWAVLARHRAVGVLGRMALVRVGDVRAGVPHVVTGWATAEPDGRKLFSGSAVFDHDGGVLAVARATWITIG